MVEDNQEEKCVCLSDGQETVERSPNLSSLLEGMALEFNKP